MKVTADDIAQLLASAPPRKVPGHVRRAAMGGRREWFLPLFGFVFGTFGMLFVWIFFPWRFVDDWRLERSDHTVPGKVRNVGETNMTINDSRVMEYVFSYALADGQKHMNTCYTTGRRWETGAEVAVRHLPDRPDIACIDGARLSKGGGASGLMVLVFPLAGYGIMTWFFVARGRNRRLLEQGRAAEADVQAVEATRMHVNYQTVYRITLSALPDTDGQPVTVKRWARPEINLLTQHALQKQPIFVLYDPRQPKRLIFPEALIGE